MSGELRFGDTVNMQTLHVVIRDPKGRVKYQPIGRAIVEAAIDEKVTASALRKGLVALVVYQGYSPTQAAEAIRTLAELGDVDFDESGFVPQWFQPDEGVTAIDLILDGAGRSLSASVRGELAALREALAEARSRGCTFYLVETEPGEPLRVARPSRIPRGVAMKGHRRRQPSKVG